MIFPTAFPEPAWRGLEAPGKSSKWISPRVFVHSEYNAPARRLGIRLPPVPLEGLGGMSSLDDMAWLKQELYHEQLPNSKAHERLPGAGSDSVASPYGVAVNRGAHWRGHCGYSLRFAQGIISLAYKNGFRSFGGGLS
jgi:hypothetical protein